MRFWLCFLLGSLSSAAVAQEPKDEIPEPTEAPQKIALTLNPGHHVGPIVDLFFTPNGKQVVSVGNDRTVQTWDIQTGERLRVLRLPTGQPLAAALAPDGKTLLVARTFEPAKRPEMLSVSPAYLLNLEDGRILPLLGDRPSATEASVAFAADGDRAFVLHGSTCRVWAGLKGIWDGKIATPGVKALTKFGSSKYIGSVGLCPTPDGTRVALRISGTVEIVDLAAPDKPVRVVTRLDNDSKVNGMAWSRDGKVLATGHEGIRNGPYTAIRLWFADGKERMTCAVASRPGDRWSSTIFRILFRTDDELILFCQRDGRGLVLLLNLANGSVREIGNTSAFRVSGTVGSLSPDGQLGAVAEGSGRSRLALFSVQEKARVRSLAGDNFSAEQIGWSLDASTVALNVNNAKHPDTALDLKELKLLDGIDPKTFAGAIHNRDGWQLKTRFFADGERLAIRHDDVEVQTSTLHFAVRYFTLPAQGDVRWAAMAGSPGLFLYDASTAKLLRKFWTPAGMRGLAPSPDGKYLLAASLAQELCVYRPDQTDPLLRIHISGSEWIVWARGGYYACSPGGERLMGWTVDNGPDKMASFYPASQFRASLYRPDVIQLVLEAGSVEKALELADKARGKKSQITDVTELLPPFILITSPDKPKVEVAEPTVEVRFIAKPVGKHPITSVRLLLNGRPYPGTEGLKKFEPPRAGEVRESWTVKLAPGENHLAVQAESAVSKALSESVTVTLPVRGLMREDGEEIRKALQPSLYVLAVGVSDYPEKLKLNYAAKDARAIAATCEKHCRNLFKKVEVKLLTDKDATRKGILQGLTWLRKQMTQHDVGVVFFAGHGAKDADGKFYLLPVDVDTDDLLSTGVPGDQVKSALPGLGKIILILDACHAGAVDGERRRAATSLTDDLVRDLATDDYGVIVMCSAMGREFALESSKVEHGFFTLAIVEGMSGKATKTADGAVYLHHLDSYVTDRVKELSEGKQHPVTVKPGSLRSFPLTKP